MGSSGEGHGSSPYKAGCRVTLPDKHPSLSAAPVQTLVLGCPNLGGHHRLGRWPQGLAWPGQCCYTCRLHRAVAALLTAARLVVSALEGKFGSIQELGGHIDFIFFPIHCRNDCSKCSDPLPLWELCWMMDTDNKLLLVFSPPRLFLLAGVQHHRSYSAKV